MKSIRKGLSILLSLCLVVTTFYGCFTFEALAEDEEDNLWSYGSNESVPASFTSGISGQINTYGFFANTVASGVVDISVVSGGYNSDHALHFVSTYASNSVGRIIEIEQGKNYKISFKYKGDGKGYPFLILNMDSRVRPGVSGKNVSTTANYTEIERKDSWNFPNCGDTWNTYEKTFTASTGNYLAILWATSSNVAGTQTNLYMDDISVVEVVDVNFKQNVNGHYVYDNFGDAGTVSAKSAANNQVTLKAVPKSGYSFMGWYYNGTKISSSATTDVSYVAGRTYIANFRTTQDVNFWADGDMETISSKYTYLGNNIVNGENPDGWVGYRMGGNNQYTRAKAVTDEKHSGSYSLQLDMWGAMRVIGRRLKLQAGRTYRFTYYRKGYVDTFGIYNHNDPDLEIVCNDAQFGLDAMDDVSGVTTLVKNRTTADEWTEFTYEFTTEAGKPYVDILWSRNSKAECYIDDVSLVQVGHYWGGLHTAVAETCTTDGTIAYYNCLDCGAYANSTHNVIPSSEIVISATGHNTVYYTAKAPTCVDKGYSQACYYCKNCKKYFSDDLCTNELNAASVEIAATGTHTIVSVAARAATCTSNGNTAHYECSVCGQGFSNSTGTSSLAQNSWITPKLTHTFGSLVAAVEPTCEGTGTKAHYRCSSCNGYFDINKNETTLQELTVPAKGHAYGTRIDGTPATCDHAGQISYYQCSDCGGYFDTDKNPVTAGELTIAQLSHDYGVIIPQQDPTCTEEGFARHYRCAHCGRYFDEDQNETTATALTLAPLGHIAVHVPYNKPKADTDGWLEHWYCERCDSYFITSNLSKKVSRSEVWLPHTATQSGTTGACTWTLVNGILTISGSGNMANYSSYNIDRPWGVQITKVIIESGVTGIGNYAFKGCSRLTEVQIANSVTRIGAGAFNGTAIETLSIGTGVTYIGAGAFENIASLTTVTVAAGNTVYKSSGNCLIEIATHTLIRGSKNAVIPTDGSVTAIGERAFYGCTALTSITIPTAVTYIGAEAFMGCAGLTSVALGTGVKTVSAYAFSGCTSLATVSGGSNVSYIGVKAFDETVWLDAQSGTNGVVYLGKVAYIYIGGSQAVSIQSGTVSISPYAFKDSAVTSITLPGGFLKIGDNAFENCTALAGISLGSSLTGIGVWAFKGCSALTSVSLPSSLTSIGYGAFSGSGLTAVVIPANVIYIEGETFMGCTDLKTVDIKSEIAGIGAYAFNGCKKLTEIVLSDALATIGYGAFEGCLKLKNVYYYGWQDDKALIVIDDANEYLTSASWTYGYEPQVVSASGTTGSVSYSVSGTTLTISGSGAMANYTYDSVLPWGTSITSVVVNSGVTKIGDYAFKNCKEITSVSLPSSVTTVGELAFFGCERLSTVSTANITTYNYGSFKGCSSLTSITINASVTSIPATCFSGCSKATSLTFSGTNVTTIGTSAFEECSKLTSVTLPSGLNTVGKKAFYGCTALKTLSINSNIVTIESLAFGKCSSIASLTVPNSTQTIGEGAFFGCSGITTISIPFVGRQRVTYSDTDKYPFGYIFGKQAYDGGEAVEQDYVTGANDPYEVSSTVTHQNRTDRTYTITYYEYDSNGGTGISKRKDDQHTIYYIPRSLRNVTVTNSSFIPAYAFENCDMITSATFSSAVTAMGHSVFKNCKGLLNFTVSNSSTSTIGKETFEFCTNLRNVSIPTGDTAMQNIEYMVFYGCVSLRNFTAPQGIKYIEPNAFNGCSNLETLRLYSNLLAIDSDAFTGCDSIRDIYTKYSRTWSDQIAGRKHSITVSGSDSPFDDDTITWHYNVNLTTENAGVTGECTWKVSSNTLTITGTGPMANYGYGEALPWGTSITSVVISSGVTNVGDYAFQGCASLTSVTIPGTVHNIGDGAFYGCKKISSITLPTSNLYSIGKYAFNGCSVLTSITLPDSITVIPAGAFGGCTALTSVTMGAKTTSIENGAFLGCNHLTSVKIPSTAINIADYAFGNCTALASLTMDNHVANIGYGAFTNTALSSVTYGGSLAQREAIELGSGNDALENATWTYLTKSGTTGACTWTLSGGVLTISGSGATENFTIDSVLPWGHDITKVVIGSGVTNISGNGYAFRNCPDLASFEVQSGSSYFTAVGNCLIRSADGHKYIVAGCKNSVIPTSSSQADVILGGAFCCVPGLTSIHIPANIISIYKRAFIGCSNVQTITATNNGTYRTNGKVIYNTSGSVVFGSAYSPNLFENGDAESVTTADLTSANGWNRTVANGQGGVVGLNVSSAQSHSGTNSYEISYIYTHGAYRTFRLTAGKTYTLSFWHKSPGAGNIQYFQIVNRANSTASSVAAGGATFDASHVQLYSRQWQFSATEWTKESYTFTLGSGMDTIDIVFTQAGTSGTPVYFDDFKLIANDDFDGFTPTEICDGAFAYNTSLDSLYIPASVTTIGTYNDVFAGSPNFSGVAVQSGNANYYSSGNTLIKDDTLDTIIAGTVCSRPSESEVITSIEDYAFCGREGLTSINISKHITSIGERAFYGCDNLETVYYSGTPAKRNSMSIEPYNTCLTGAKWISSYSGTTGSCTWSVSDTTLTITGSGAMANYTDGTAPWPKNITKVVISSGVTKVGNYAFSDMRELASVELASGLTTIGEGAFKNCKKLTEIDLPSSVTTIGAYAFYGDEALERVDTGSSITSIGAYAFADSGIRAAVIPAGVTTISEYAFSSCKNLVNVVIANGVTTISKGAFAYDNALASIELPASVTTIGDNAFDGCTNLKSFSAGKNLATLGNEVLKNTRNLESIKIDPLNSNFESLANTIVRRSGGNVTILYGCKNSVVATGVTAIASGAFYGSGMTDLYLASSVTSIAYDAFANSGVVRVSYQGTSSARNSISMGSNNALLKDNVVWTYGATCGTSGDLEWYYIGTKLYLIGNGAMADYTGSNSAPWRYVYDSDLGQNVDRVITDVFLDQGITYIGAYAFDGCTTLKNIDLPVSIEDIGIRAFFGCAGLEHITMGEGNERYYAQGDCLIEIDEENGNSVILGTRNSVIPEDDEVVYIASDAFRNNTELRTIEIPANICGINAEAFRGCTSLAQITFNHNSSFEVIDHAAFYGCTAIDNVYFIGSTSNMNKLKNKIQSDNDCLADADWSAVTACEIHGHVYDAVYEEVPATCTTNGTIAYRHCSVCNKNYDMDGNLKNTAASRRINATGHDHVYYPALDSTHTTQGHAAYYFCPGCGTYYDTELNETTWEDLLTSTIDYVYGDVDNSGTVDLYDAIILRQYVAYYNPSLGTSTVVVYEGADANADGKVDLMDVVLIRQYLAYYDDETGTSTVHLGPLA